MGKEKTCVIYPNVRVLHNKKLEGDWLLSVVYNSESPWLSSSSEEILTQKAQRQLQVLKNEFFDFITKISKYCPLGSKKGRALIHSGYLQKLNYVGKKKDTHREKNTCKLLKCN